VKYKLPDLDQVSGHSYISIGGGTV